MPTPFSHARQSVALYWDFENLHAGLCEARQEGSYSKQDNRFRVQEPLIDVQAVTELAASFGPIAINRAYCNWQYFSRYRDALLQSAAELIQLFPPGGTAKNGADIKLCLDAMEDLGRFDHIGTVIIIGGDSDFMPMSQKIKAAGRRLIGVATRQSTNRHWARSCHEFRYYESLIGGAHVPAMAAGAGAGTGPAGFAGAVAPADSIGLAGLAASALNPAADILARALAWLAQTPGCDCASQSDVWRMVKRLDSTFEPREHGYADFAAMLQAFDVLVDAGQCQVERGVRLR